MRTFDQWLIEEGLTDLIAPVRLVYRIVKEIDRLPNRTMEGILIHIRDNYPDLWSKLEKLAGDPVVVRTLSGKIAMAQSGDSGKPIGESTGSPTIDAIQEIARIISSFLPVVSAAGYIAAAVFISWLSLRLKTNLSDLLSMVVDLGKQGKGLLSKPKSPELIRIQKEREARDAARREAQKARTQEGPHKPHSLPRPPPSMIQIPKGSDTSGL